ncbi:uncharacterized protein BO80DRAFT_421251 [Aspergillus ibericus CBS 121593]|uniref:Uncharacterized protein n=1 Tax=Aspergillus ibericus CBS 121593 TaxID=1448316 RepID=A0A395HDL5_9EURO|nr:hypothetical protein BO80DRAFT_421251 [Aspergillus ibericus CBS 121593]RAL05195.1 hypothetical protein BO80DRAFT_421251 [Aspergillus ibericus CBS 121593]
MGGKKAAGENSKKAAGNARVCSSSNFHPSCGVISYATRKNYSYPAPAQPPPPPHSEKSAR